MNEIVDRAARAMCNAHDGCDPDDIEGGPHPGGLWLDKGEPWWTGYRELARAAIEAAREPSDAMLDAGAQFIGPGGPGLWIHKRTTAGDVFRAMIGAAPRD